MVDVGGQRSSSVITAEPKSSSEGHVREGKGERGQPDTNMWVGPQFGARHHGQRKEREGDHSVHRIFRCSKRKIPS